MLNLIGLAVTIGAAVFGYFAARGFTRDRLRYVDAAQKASAAVIAGIAAFLVTLPIVWVLPLVGTGTALLFGAAVGAGVSAGARDIRKRLSSG